MRSHRAVLSVSLAIACAASACAAMAGEASVASFAQGMELLRKGDLGGALDAVGAATRAEPENPSYRQQYMLLQRVVKTREAIAGEADPEKWWRLALGLQNFYYAHGLYEEMVKLGRQMHEKQPSVSSAILLADAHLALGQNAEAEQVLGGPGPPPSDPQAQALLGIALARQKKVGQAKAVLGGIAAPEAAGPRLLFDLARLRVLCGDADGGLATLKTAFESASPRALDAFRNLAKSCGDFARLATGEAFARALATESKVVESSCSDGAGCGSCPRRGGGCPSAEGGPGGPK